MTSEWMGLYLCCLNWSRMAAGSEDSLQKYDFVKESRLRFREGSHGSISMAGRPSDSKNVMPKAVESDLGRVCSDESKSNPSYPDM